jgi:hypothetical protein
MRAVFALPSPHPGPLPQGEGEKRRALFGDRISKRVGRNERRELRRMCSLVDHRAAQRGCAEML